jgi:glycosyltransferase involved in cell wall biosynthesis
MSLAEQTQKNFEVIIADDGSKEETRDTIVALKEKLPFPLTHIWQEDQGFQVAKIRNKAVLTSRGDYLIFLDGDCIVPKYFIEKHRNLAKENSLVVGNRLLLSEKFTNEIFEKNIFLPSLKFKNWIFLRLTKKISRISPLLKFGLKLNFLRFLRKKRWRGAKTCNLGIWKKDFFAVNGFEEGYAGWGYEDSDLVIRMQRNGVLRKDGHFVIPVFHLWHSYYDRGKLQNNQARLDQILTSTIIRSKRGIDQYLGK